MRLTLLSPRIAVCRLPTAAPIPQWPAGPFVYLVLRNDAVDVVYGTMSGYEGLGIPYMAHIAPAKRW